MTSNENPSLNNVYAGLQLVAISSTRHLGERSAFVSSSSRDVGGHDDSREGHEAHSGQGRGCESNYMKSTRCGHKNHVMDHCWGCWNQFRPVLLVEIKPLMLPLIRLMYLPILTLQCYLT